MSGAAQITLGGAEYTLRQFNIGQIERVTDLLDQEGLAPVKRSFALIRIVLECVEPAVPDPKALRASVDEITAAIKTAMQLSGLASGDEGGANPPQPVAG